jgi:hypothetical protein
VGEQIARA